MGQTDLINFFVRRKENLNKKMVLVDEKKKKRTKNKLFWQKKWGNPENHCTLCNIMI